MSEQNKQVVLNFLSNAIKYNCPNGQVTLRARMGKNEWMFDVQDLRHRQECLCHNRFATSRNKR